jgi:hypothetical protein
MRLTLSKQPRVVDGPILRWVSDAKIWEVQINPVLFGFRVHVCHRDEPSTYLCDYCAGDQRHWVKAIAMTVIEILSGFEEDAHPRVVESIFPPQQIKPMSCDPVCWGKLCTLADNRATTHN